mmetsp:Transcript_54159/g.86107  ORF Transcript_54159/g.86107 Transcript_54159/m.86107 type:complete len:203 (-) Transcript_54159:196-804(-)
MPWNLATIDLIGVYISRCAASQQMMHRSRRRSRHSEQRGACVDHSMATAISTLVQHSGPNSDLLNLDLPMTQIWPRHRCPFKLRGRLVLVVTSKGYLALRIFTSRQENGELRHHPRFVCDHFAKKTELGMEPQRVQAQSHNTIEFEHTKRILCHIGRQNNTHRKTIGISTSHANDVFDELSSDLASAIRNDNLVTILSVWFN